MADLFRVTPTLLARLHDHAVGEITRRVRDGALFPGGRGADVFSVGLGHSMGSLVTCAQQARHQSFEALVLLGRSGFGLPEVLTAGERAVSGKDLASLEEQVVDLARKRFASESGAKGRALPRGSFFGADVPDAVKEAFARCRVPLLGTCGLTSMIPFSAAAERAAISVPTFLGFGSDDPIDRFEDTRSQFRSVQEAELFVLEGSGHCHNMATDRRQLWDRIASWTWSRCRVASGSSGG